MSELTTAAVTVAPQTGDIWKEVDPRAERYVRVMEVSSGYARMARCDAQGDNCATRFTRARLDRFHGKRGGYALHQSAS